VLVDIDAQKCFLNKRWKRGVKKKKRKRSESLNNFLWVLSQAKSKVHVYNAKTHPLTTFF
jgi:hypothetical protein